MTKASWLLILGFVFLPFGGGMYGAKESEERVVIKNLRSGLVCSEENAEKRICVETTEIEVNGQDECALHGSEVPCTWYGFSFDYRKLKRSVALDCTWSSDESMNLGGPDRIDATDVTESPYQLELVANETHFINPQYSVLPIPSERPDNVIRITNSCSHQGTKLFTVVFNIRFDASIQR